MTGSTTVKSSSFGKTDDGKDVTLYKLSSKLVSVGVINYGGTIVKLEVPDRNGKLEDIVTGFETFKEYKEKSQFFGCIVGRYGNRIAKGKFTLDNKQYTLAVNNGPNALHGGIVGFDKKLWNCDELCDGVKMSLISPDGDEGYPGQLDSQVIYRLVDDQLTVEYKATCDKSTPINLTNHTYFNLSGHTNWESNLSGHVITMNADKYLPADDNCLVNGEIRAVEGSVFDLRSGVKLEEGLLESVKGGGFDHTFCFHDDRQMRKIAEVYHCESGRKMEVSTNQPGVQFYTGNFLKGQQGKMGVNYVRHSAFCLETQNFPDAINHPGKFPNCVLKPGEEYYHKTIFKFTA